MLTAGDSANRRALAVMATVEKTSELADEDEDSGVPTYVE